MEFKYAKNSDTLENVLEKLQNERLVKRIQNDTEMEMARQERIRQKDLQGYFRSADELIKYVIEGGILVDHTMYDEWIELINGEIVEHTFECDDHGFPLGYVDRHMPVEKFIEQVRRWEKYQKEDNCTFVSDSWHRGTKSNIYSDTEV